jgi:hypothetical protein
VLNQEAFIKVQKDSFIIPGKVKAMNLVFINEKYCVGFCFVFPEVNKMIALAFGKPNDLIETMNMWRAAFLKVVFNVFFQRKYFKLTSFRLVFVKMIYFYFRFCHPGC